MGAPRYNQSTWWQFGGEAPQPQGAPAPALWLDPRDAVNDGGGKVLNCADRVSGAVYSSPSSGTRFTRNTSFAAGGVLTFQSTGQSQTLSGTITGTWNGTQPTTLVQRVYVGQGNTTMMFGQLDTAATPTNRQLWQGTDAVQLYMTYTRSGTGGGTTATNASCKLVVGAWRTYSFTWDGTTARFWVNTTNVYSVARAGSITSAIDRFSVGTIPSGGANGLIGYRGAVRLFNRALTANEVAQEHAFLSGIWK